MTTPALLPVRPGMPVERVSTENIPSPWPVEHREPYFELPRGTLFVIVGRRVVGVMDGRVKIKLPGVMLAYGVELVDTIVVPREFLSSVHFRPLRPQ